MMISFKGIYICLKCLRNTTVMISFRQENQENIKIIPQHNLFVFTLYRRLFWSPACFIIEWRLSDTAPAVSAMCRGSLSFPAPATIMTIPARRPSICVIVVGCQTRGPWRLLRYQQERTNTSTFAGVIDLYLPTFLTAFSSYWQHKHVGWGITFHLRSSSLSPFCLYLCLARPPAQPASRRSCNLFK